MPDFIVVSEVDESIVVSEEPQQVVIASGIQGPPGPQGAQGPAGPIGDAGGAFLVTNRLSEISSDEVAKAAARANIGLAVVDGGTFF